jgi:hypothetical protein
MPEGLKPFRIDIPEIDLTDLRDRLRRTRWPDPEPVDDWSQGIPLAYIHEAMQYLGRPIDWRGPPKRGSTSFRNSGPTPTAWGVQFLQVRSPHAELSP